MPRKSLSFYILATMNENLSELRKQFEAELYGLYVINTKALGDLVKARIFVESEREVARQKR